MTLPQPIVAYQKRASDHPDPFGTWCKLHHAFLTHLAEGRLSGAAYKVVLQVLWASFNFGQYRPASLSLEQFQSSQHLGRKAVIEGLRQAVARGILYEEGGWQKGGHAPKQYGLVFYRASAVGRREEDQHHRQQGIALPKGGAGTPEPPGSATSNAVAQDYNTQGSSTSEPYRRPDEGMRATTGSEIEPVEGAQPVRTEAGSAKIEPVTELLSALPDATGAEIEPAPVCQPHQFQCGNRTSAGALTAPEALPQDGHATRSTNPQERKENRDVRRTPASLARTPKAAQENLTVPESLITTFIHDQPSSAEAAASCPPVSLVEQATNLGETPPPADLATLCAERERRKAELAGWHPHGVEQIQAKIAARLEMRRLERQIEELESPLSLCDQTPQERAGSGGEGKPNEASEGATQVTSAHESVAPLSLRVAEEQLAQWHVDVAAQQREVTRVKTQYQAVTEQLQQCRIGRGDWGTLMREQRFLAGEVEEQEAELARYERFIALIEQGATREEACERLLALPSQEAALEARDATELTPTEQLSEDEASQSPPEPAPRLEGQLLRKALFATLVRLFTTGDSRHVELERGKFNRAIKNLVLADLQPEEIPILKATYERLWPKITCTALGLANHLPLLIEEARKRGYEVGTPLESRREIMS